MEIVTTKIHDISKRGRVALFGKAGSNYYSVALDCEFVDLDQDSLVVGSRYTIAIDTALKLIHSISSPVKVENIDSELIQVLYKRLDHLEKVNQVQREFITDYDEFSENEYNLRLAELEYKGRISLKDYKSELSELEHGRTAQDVDIKHDTWINYTSNPGLVTMYWEMITGGNQDRFKNGKDIKEQISKYCDDVPPGMIPEEIKDHLPAQWAG